MKLVIFGNGVISKTFQIIHDIPLKTISVDIASETQPDYIGDICDDVIKRKLLDEDDILVDLTNGQDTFLTADWCWRNNVNYINADISSQDSDLSINGDIEKRYDKFIKIANERKIGKTILFSQGMNPGMVSVYFNKLIKDYDINTKEIKEVQVSEIDTQFSDMMPKKQTVISTWCIDSLFEDGIAESSLWKKEYWQSKVDLKQNARDNIYWAKNPWFNEFKTMLSGNHEEIYEIGKTFDLPVCFSYKPPIQFGEATKNLNILDNINKHIMNMDDVVCGENIVGTHIIMKNEKEYWCGSRLFIENVKKLIKREIKSPVLNATSVLTAAGVIAGVHWIIENKNRGYVMPLEMDIEYTIKKAKPFLGDFFVGELKN